MRHIYEQANEVLVWLGEDNRSGRGLGYLAAISEGLQEIMATGTTLLINR